MALVMASPIATLDSSTSAVSTTTATTSSSLVDSQSPHSSTSFRISSSSSGRGLAPPASPYPQHVDPSPTDSNGTESTEIDEDSQEDTEEETPEPTPSSKPTSPSSGLDNLSMISTDLSTRLRSNSDEAPQSVIHAPPHFAEFRSSAPLDTEPRGKNTTQRKERGLESPTTPDAAVGPDDKRMSGSFHANGDHAHGERIERTNPHAQARQADGDVKSSPKAGSILEDIPEVMQSNDEGDEADNESSTASTESGTVQQNIRMLSHAEMEVAPLRSALDECWTLCNTLAGLSSGQRQRVFSLTPSNNTQEHAWRSCWRLCQQLYKTHNQPSAKAMPLLELCRDFCQALFEVRQRGDEATDSVLRVSFEMNNHLYNTHDRHLPETFRERTLVFYITLCHRMMKQRTTLAHETDSVLRACWTLAEMLFNLRQASQGCRPPDEELLSSAVQACWELCDMFREEWARVRPDRGTPRPSQASFSSNIHSSSFNSSDTSLVYVAAGGGGGSGPGDVASSARPTSSLSSNSYHDAAPSLLPPETPITIFDDTGTSASSPDSVTVPNIIVLGPTANTTVNASGLARTAVAAAGAATHHERWSSNASTLSAAYPESAVSGTSSKRTSSTATAGTQGSHLLRLQYLILKAAVNAGFTRLPNNPAAVVVATTASTAAAAAAATTPAAALAAAGADAACQPFPAFVKAAPQDAFGPLPWQQQALEQYKRLVEADKSLRFLHTLPGRRLSAKEVARAVGWLVRDDKWAWMRDLYRVVCGFGVEEVGGRGGGIVLAV